MLGCHLSFRFMLVLGITNNWVVFQRYGYFYVHYVCVYMHHICALCLRRPVDDIISPGTGAIESCELPRGCWEPNLGSLKEQQCLTTKLSLELCNNCFPVVIWTNETTGLIEMLWHLDEEGCRLQIEGQRWNELLYLVFLLLSSDESPQSALGSL